VNHILKYKIDGNRVAHVVKAKIQAKPKAEVEANLQKQQNLQQRKVIS
jgi:hypothetical protein